MTSPFRKARGRIAAGVAGTLVAALALAGCSSSSSPNTSATPDAVKITANTAAPSGDIDSVTWAVYAEPLSLDYAYAFDYPDNQVLANVCESLLRLNPDWTLSPSLATSFEHPKPNVWVYNLRQGVKFHDGTPMTAADVVASMKRHMDPAVGSSWADVYKFVTSITQTGPSQVTVTESQPDSQFNLMMGSAPGVVESAAYLKKAGKNYGNSTGLVDCTGPYKIDSWTSGQSIQLSRDDAYWDKDLMAKNKTFKFVFLQDATARVNALKSGAVDGSFMVPTEAISQLQNTSAGNLYFGLNTAVNSLIISNLKGALGDLKVRQAIMAALDRQGMTKAATGGVGQVSNALTTESVWSGASAETTKRAFADLKTYPLNLDKAKQLVKEAGAEGKTVTIATAPIGNDFNIVSQGTAAALQSIGMKAKIVTVTPAQYSALFSDPTARKGIDLFYTNWYLSSPDPLEMYAILQTGQFSNYADWSDPTYDKIVNQAIKTQDPEARAVLSAQAQKITNEQLPWLPLAAGPMTMFLGKKITGASPSVAFLYYPWAATIGKR
ncbi:peptide ABC transporter substrate-binding protein [Microbacterium mangrovi]|uniref:Peptide ABC transporter substrate-binding protein n=1 Tax=Microbacterium mangrovi TaxID=1348253 RepID=A0A0B2ACS3_9MICO|nr:ABC transporter substrate-binding protein [Microbacterium mangrovi]KHK99568.1 peptide ABC transporter substrate-binding protein [Microbacterium mangrovi]